MDVKYIFIKVVYRSSVFQQKVILYHDLNHKTIEVILVNSLKVNFSISLLYIFIQIILGSNLITLFNNTGIL